MCAVERGFVVPSLCGIVCSWNSNKEKMVFTKANKEEKLRRNSIERYKRRETMTQRMRFFAYT